MQTRAVSCAFILLLGLGSFAAQASRSRQPSLRCRVDASLIEWTSTGPVETETVAIENVKIDFSRSTRTHDGDSLELLLKDPHLAEVMPHLNNQKMVIRYQAPEGRSPASASYSLRVSVSDLNNESFDELAQFSRTIGPREKSVELSGSATADATRQILYDLTCRRTR